MRNYSGQHLKSLYKIVQHEIRQKIINREWSPGECLPSEQELGTLFNASQGTVRKALTELEINNIVTRHQGKGTFVSRHTSEQSLFRFFHLIGDNNSWQEPHSRLISCNQVKATVIQANRLGLKTNEKIWKIERVRDFDGQETIVEDICLSTKKFSHFLKHSDTLPNTLYQYYEDRYGISITHAEERIKSVAAEKREANLLNIKVSTPLLRIERVAFGLDNLAVELRISYCLTEKHYYACSLD